ncbi:hypothetical protein [Stenotrophomonas sp.]|uniref:antitoxin PaaA2 family protein n=1 Tax=Stenotrophomonas sp. TaxID=69392 RepID=UPI0028B0AEC1|nr:hypothetical protein [Stenotrophomonas sp.]
MMNAVNDPSESQFDVVETKPARERWLEAKVKRSLTDSRPAIPHDEVERRMARRVEELKADHKVVALSGI